MTTATEEKTLGFVAGIKQQNLRKRNLVVLSGDIEGLYPVSGEYMSLEPTLISTFGNEFNVVTYDINGVGFAREEGIEEISQYVDLKQTPKEKNLGGLKDFLDFGKSRNNFSVEDENLMLMVKRVTDTDFQPLHSLQLLSFISGELNDKKVKPLCIVIRDGGLLFPRKALFELDAF
jgi:hypothetical protein